MRQEDGNIRALLRNTWRLYVKLVHVTLASVLTTSNNQFKKQIERICKPPDEGNKSPSLYVMQRHEESTEQACESSSENEKSAQQPQPQPQPQQHQRDPFTVTVTTYSKCNCDGCEKLAAKKDYFVRHNRPNPDEWPGPGPGSTTPPTAESEKVFTITSTTSATKYPKLHISEKQPPPPLFDKLSPTTSSSGESDSRIYTKDEIKSKLDDLDNSKILKRERNRLAARRCRQNQRDRISILERDVRDMESQNGIVQQEIQLLQSQAKQLSGMLLNHKCVLKLSSGGNDIKQVYTTKHSQQ